MSWLIPALFWTLVLATFFGATLCIDQIAARAISEDSWESWSEHSAEKDAGARHAFCGDTGLHRPHWHGDPRSLFCYGMGATDLGGRVLPPRSERLVSRAEFRLWVAAIAIGLAFLLLLVNGKPS